MCCRFALDRWEADQAERDERAARRKEWDAENAPEPFYKEVRVSTYFIYGLSLFGALLAALIVC